MVKVLEYNIGNAGTCKCGAMLIRRIEKLLNEQVEVLACMNGHRVYINSIVKEEPVQVEVRTSMGKLLAEDYKFTRNSPLRGDS